jgi:PST family polysaccharide transporter
MKEVVKAAMTTGGAAVLAMLLSAITGKVISVVAGPAGIGLYSLQMQLYATALAFAAFGGGGNAVVQGVASREGEERDRFIVTTGWIHVASAVIVGLLFLLAAPVVLKLLKVEDQTLDMGSVRALAVPIVLGTLVVFLTGLVNGYREIKALARNRVMSSAVIAALAYPAAMILRGGSQLAFVGLIASGLLVQAVGLAVDLARKKLFASAKFLRRDLLVMEPVRHFTKVAGTFLAAGQLAAVGGLLITAAVVARSGLAGAGWLTASLTISTGYLMLVLGSFGTYYAPTVAAAPDIPAVRTVIGDVFRVSLLASVPIIVAIVVLKPMVILLLYTEEFLPTLKVLRWMLIGDFLKIFSWIFAIPLSSRAKLKVYLVSEVAMIVLYYLLTIGYACFLLFHVWYARVLWEFVPTRRDTLVWMLGFAVIIGASWQHWDRQGVRAVDAALWITAAVLVSWWGLGSAERAGAIGILRRRFGR